jgi:hypothetical protein
MNHITCPCESCKKEFDNPVVVTNFSDVTSKEVYYACPYCLTKLEFKTEECTCEIDEDEELFCDEIEQENEKQKMPSTQQATSDDYESVQAIVKEKLEALQKQRAELMSELDELRTVANQKISDLEKEVAALREQKELLEEIIAE